jgi:hypothetical protein
LLFEKNREQSRNTETDRKPQSAVVVGKAYDFVLWLLPKVENLPKSYRHSVGERLTQQGLDLLLTLVEAAYTREKAALLSKANGIVNGLRYLLRLAKDLRLLTLDAFAFAVERLDEVGRMAGGWYKAAAKTT